MAMNRSQFSALRQFPFCSYLVAAAALLACSAAGANSFVDAAPQRLAEFIRVDTVNPPGNETNGVRFFADIFDAAGIEYDSAESAPGRGNIWARLRGGRKPGLILLNHMDVVPADARHWSVPPYAGLIRDGFIWGRGAIDMKGTGIMQLQAFLHLAARVRAGARLNRDVIFLATADEETGGAQGAGWLVRHRSELFKRAGWLLNEGGSVRLTKQAPLYLVEVTQKVPVWLRLTATDRPGHGSSPTPTTAVTRILRAGARLADTRFPARVVPTVERMFAGLAPFEVDQRRRAAFADIAEASRDDRFLRRLAATNPGLHALLRNTCSLTRLEGSSKINVIPPQASLELDCRILPDQDEAAFIEKLRAIANDPNIVIEKLMSLKPAESPADSELLRAIERLVTDRDPGARVIPQVSTGFTDSHYFRTLGINSYGLGFFMVPPEDVRGVHGNDERLGVASLKTATSMLIELLERFAVR
ncbi:MAG: M20/M25/M40 family metallo-hydrolase [Pseudomonadota bacterium]